MKKIILLSLCSILILCLTGCNTPEKKDTGENTNNIDEKTKYFNIKMEDIEADNMDVQMIIDPLWEAVSIYDGEEKYEEDLSNFSLPQRYVFAIQWYIGEVNNGGHYQFFDNSTGIVWKDVLKGLKEIGYSEAEENLRAALDKIGGNPPLDRDQRQELLNTYDPDFEEEDSTFYEMEDLEDKVAQYVKAHASDFLFKGTVNVAY